MKLMLLRYAENPIGSTRQVLFPAHEIKPIGYERWVYHPWLPTRPRPLHRVARYPNVMERQAALNPMGIDPPMRISEWVPAFYRVAQCEWSVADIVTGLPLIARAP